MILKKTELAFALIVTGLALYLSLRFFTHAGPLWRDEVGTLHFATQPSYTDLLHSLDLMSLPPLYPTLLRLWLSVGWVDHDLGARVFGLLIALAFPLTIWFCAKALDGEWPLLTLALGAAHAAVLSMIGLLRPYGLGTIFILATACAVWRLVWAPRRATFLVAAVMAILAVQSQYQNELIIFVVCVAGVVAALMGRDWKTSGLVVVVGALAGLSLLPYVGVVSRSRQWLVLAQTLNPDPLSWLVIRFVDLVTMYSPTALAMWVVIIGLAGYGIARVLWTASDDGGLGRRRTVYAAVVVVGSIVSFLLFFKSVERSFQTWHVVPLIAVTALSLDMIFAPPLWPRITRLAIAVVAVAISLPIAITQVGIRQTNIDLIARFLQREAALGDLIVIDPWFIGITFRHYYQGPVESMTVPPIEDLRIHRFDLEKERMMSREPLAPLKQAILKSLEGGHRVWVVGGMRHLPTGFAPRDLPPPPLPLSGWADAPYTINWSVQISHLLQAHGRRRYFITIPLNQAVNGYENASLSMVEGWAS